MNKLPIELQINIYQYLDIYSISQCVSKSNYLLCKSNPIWEPIVCKKFGHINSTNYYESYKYQKNLAYKKFLYKRQYTLGCVGKITPLIKPDWDDAIKII